jgi:glycosyltransferase involved in cell wall biosynthesis
MSHALSNPPTHSNIARKKVVLFGSCTDDWGTKSITEAYVSLLSPSITIRLERGLKKMRPLEVLKLWRFLYTQRKTGVTVVCLHRAPTLIAGLFPFPRHARWITILESNESCPYGLTGLRCKFYDAIYRIAFRRLDAVYSPFFPFRKYYQEQGISIKSCFYPLPFPVESLKEWKPAVTTRVLFIGADYTRKGGDLLLAFWAKSKPKNATLTFVCPSPPMYDSDDVVFLTEIKIGTPAHHNLLTNHDIIILPTFQDPFGFALLEAINFGICAITTSAAGAASIVIESGGIVANTPQAAIAELAELCNNPEDIKERQLKCRNFVHNYDQALRDSMNQIL